MTLSFVVVVAAWLGNFTTIFVAVAYGENVNFTGIVQKLEMKCSLHPIEVAQVLTLSQKRACQHHSTGKHLHFVEYFWGKMFNFKKNAFIGDFSFLNVVP